MQNKKKENKKLMFVEGKKKKKPSCKIRTQINITKESG